MPSAVGPALLRSEPSTRLIEILRVQLEPDGRCEWKRRIHSRRGARQAGCACSLMTRQAFALKAAYAEEGFRGGRGGGGGYLRGGGRQDLEERGTVNSLSGGASRRIALRNGKIDTPTPSGQTLCLRKPSECRKPHDGGLRTTRRRGFIWGECPAAIAMHLYYSPSFSCYFGPTTCGECRVCALVPSSFLVASSQRVIL